MVFATGDLVPNVFLCVRILRVNWRGSDRESSPPHKNQFSGDPPLPVARLTPATGHRVIFFAGVWGQSCIFFESVSAKKVRTDPDARPMFFSTNGASDGNRPAGQNRFADRSTLADRNSKLAGRNNPDMPAGVDSCQSRFSEEYDLLA